jgi:hypothetical protein
MTGAAYRRMLRRRKVERFLYRHLPIRKWWAVRLSRLLP